MDAVSAVVSSLSAIPAGPCQLYVDASSPSGEMARTVSVPVLISAEVASSTTPAAVVLAFVQLARLPLVGVPRRDRKSVV